MNNSQETSILQESQVSQDMADPRTVWISIPAAAGILGISDSSVRNLLRKKLVTRRHVPGSQVKLYRPDVERLARDSTVPGSLSR